MMTSGKRTMLSWRHRWLVLACSNDGLERTLFCNSVGGGWAYQAQMGLRHALKSLPTSPPLLVIICPHGGMPTW